MPNYLLRNPEAENLHEAGLEAAIKRQDFLAAHESFDAANHILQDLPPNVDTIVQAARITRDDGFTYVRQALVEGEPQPLSFLTQAELTLQQSLQATAPYVNGTELINTEAILPHDTPKQARREIYAEHGATLNCLGRLATARPLIVEQDTEQDDQLRVRDLRQQAYGLSHEMHRIGNNGYYRVINAMTAARQERLNSRMLHMGVWLGRAASGWLWTIANDQGNLRRATEALVSRTTHLRSYEAVRKSITKKP